MEGEAEMRDCAAMAARTACICYGELSMEKG